MQLKKYGAEKIFVFFSHAVCSGSWRRKIFGSINPFTQIFASTTILRGEENRTGGMVHDISPSGEIASAVFQVLNSILK